MLSLCFPLPRRCCSGPSKPAFLLHLPGSTLCTTFVTAGVAHLPAFSQQQWVMVSGKHPSRLPQLPSLCGLRCSLLPRDEDSPLNPPLFLHILSWLQSGARSLQFPILLSLGSLRGLFSPHCGCHSLRSGWQKLLPGTEKQPPHWSPFLQPLPALPD